MIVWPLITTLLVSAPLCSTATFNMPLKEKVKKSDFIVVATVKSVEKNKKPSQSRDSTRILETAHHIATIEVVQVVKGAAKIKRLKVGFKTNTVFDATKLKVGGRYLLFLHKSPGVSFLGVTAWQFGALSIFKDKSILGMLFGVKKAKVPLKDAITIISDVMKNKAHDPRYKPENCPDCPNPQEDM
jgi:hypothetical protein